MPSRQRLHRGNCKRDLTRAGRLSRPASLFSTFLGLLESLAPSKPGPQIPLDGLQEPGLRSSNLVLSHGLQTVPAPVKSFWLAVTASPAAFSTPRRQIVAPRHMQTAAETRQMLVSGINR